MSKFLINQPPLQVLPNLAKEIGLNEAIVLQQMHYWLDRTKHFKEDKAWIYNTYKKWQDQFPFWSETTIKRVIISLEKRNLIISTSKFNKSKIDKTKWYSINYSELEKMENATGQNDPSTGQNDLMDGSNRPHASGQNDLTNTKRIPETTQKDIVEIINYLNTVAGTHYKSSSQKSKRLIIARFNEEFTVDDFKSVINKKVAMWADDPKMVKYIRPETLFGTKFEGYLNEKIGEQTSVKNQEFDIEGWLNE